MKIFKKRSAKNTDSVVWRDAGGKIRCLGDNCPQANWGTPSTTYQIRYHYLYYPRLYYPEVMRRSAQRLIFTLT